MNENNTSQDALSRRDADRAVFLEQACAGRPELRAAVEALLDAHPKPGFVLDRAPVDLEQTVDSEPGEALPQQTGEYTPQPLDSLQRGTSDYPREGVADAIIGGRYTLQEKIGEGGMGEVWVAKQTEPVKRKVALKLIKTGMDSRAVLQRFEQERQALALMDHPNIARVLDGGMTPTGQPFFVMELVNGLPLTKFCDEMKLTPKERLELFVPICQAVQHAHQKGIVHRDLKPANILVTRIDGKPVPKVIDFGVAKATSGKLTEETMSTGFGAVVGTLEYMSPEQAGFSGEDIDTRADIYSLGVILYELLTGLRPIDASHLKKAAFTEMIRIIREEEPSKPSTRLSTDASLPSIAAMRQMEPKKLMALLRGELDWVVMKCLEKHRERRYETANALARDVQRYLADEAVEARPPSTGYLLQKFVKRNKVQVIAVSLVVFTLLAGVVGTTLGLFEANRQRERADVRAEGERRAKLDAQEKEKLAIIAAEKERIATELTAARLQQIETINNTVFDIFTEFDIRKVKEGKDPVEYVLAKKLIAAGKKLDSHAIHDPLVLAKLQNRLGHTLLSLGQAPASIELLTAAFDVQQTELGRDHPDSLNSMSNLALGYKVDGKLDRALPLFEEALMLTNSRLGYDHPDTLMCMNNLGMGYQVAGRLDKALPLYEETLALRKARLGPNHPDTLISMSNLALGYKADAKLDKALPLFEETLRLQKAELGPDHPDTLISMGYLAMGYQVAGKLNNALPLYEETLALTKASLGHDHPQTLMIMNSLAMGYQAAGKLDNALPLYEAALTLTKARLGHDHPDTLMSMNNLATVYRAAGQRDKALALLEETLMHQKAKLGPDHPDALLTMNNLAFGYQAAGKLDKALPLFEEAATGIELRRFQHEHVKHIISNTIAAYEAAKQFDKVEVWRRKWLVVVKAEAGAESPAYALELASLGLLLSNQGHFAEAEPVLRECLTIREKTQPDVWSTFNIQSMLGGALLGQKKYADAEMLLLKGYAGLKQREAAISKSGKIRLDEALERLVALYTDWHAAERDKGYDARAAEWQMKLNERQAVAN